MIHYNMEDPLREPTKCNLSPKRRPRKEQRRESGESCRLDPEDSSENEQAGLWWFRFLTLSVGFSIINIATLPCHLGLRYPERIPVRKLILKLPSLCQKTVKYTTKFLLLPASYVRVPKGMYGKQDGGRFWYAGLPKNGRTRKALRVATSVLVAGTYLPVPVFVAVCKILCCPLFLAKNVVRRRRCQGSRRAVLYSEALKWQVKCYRMMPLRTLSTAWGFVHNIYVPVFLRPLFLSWYVKAFGCDLSEAEVDDIYRYENLGELFRRNLKAGVRPIEEGSCLVSPVDGTVLHFGKVEQGLIEQVKGVTYGISQFLGPLTWGLVSASDNCGLEDLQKYSDSLKLRKVGTSLYHCVIYLAPGDYHKFHSPTDWIVRFRRHFAGELLSVNPTVAKLISGLFSLNERAVYNGEWEHGFFSFSAVGATNVGSIRVYKDQDLITNSRLHKKGEFKDKPFSESLQQAKGEKFGEFNLGSTVVMIFEAPDDFQFRIQNGQHIQVGQALS